VDRQPKSRRRSELAVLYPAFDFERTGRQVGSACGEAKTADGTIPASLLARIHHPRLWSSVLTRTGPIAGVITVMVAKPGLVAALCVLLAGYLTGAATARLTPLSPQAMTGRSSNSYSSGR
jgi:hypothetical protein